MTQGHDSGRSTRQNITTVSLMDTWEIKQNLRAEGGNFSRFVRNCLREWARYEQEVPCMKEEYDREILCFPRESRLCVKCWPEGPPAPIEWAKYSGTDLGPNWYGKSDEHKKRVIREYHNDAWIQEQAKEYNASLGGDSWTVKDLPWRGRPPKAKEKPKIRFSRKFWIAYKRFKQEMKK